MKKSKSMCIGCEDNFYNGNNQLGVKECWMYKTAKIVDKIQIHINQSPPYDKNLAEKRLNCFHKKQYVFTSPSSLTFSGYWK